MEEKVLTDDDFYAKYHPEFNKVLQKERKPGIKSEDLCSYGGCMYETFGEEYEIVQAMCKENPKRVWTIITVGEWEGICAGWHYVNRTGYLITDEEWENDNETYVSWDNTELHEQWDSLPVEALEEVIGEALQHRTEMDLEEIRDENFYKWEELGEQERDRILEKYKNQINEPQDNS